MEQLVIQPLLAALGNPQNGLHCVHVAGTNGKGSICAMVSAILADAGYRTGLYTSPHLQRFNERIRVDGLPIADDDLADIEAEVAAAARQIVAQGAPEPGYFDLATAAGFVYFQRCGCDAVVLEVGLGGRLDATNAIPCPDCAVIAHIGYDHTELLGNTLEAIAAEKAGIIKDSGRVVLYRQTPGVQQVVAEACRQHSCALTVADPEAARVHSVTLDGTVFDWHGLEGLELSLLGRYQLGNAVTALSVIETLTAQGYRIPEAAIRSGLKRAYWPGRLELLGRNPAVLLDGAHNPQGTAALMDSLQDLFPGKKPILIMGSFADKDYAQSIDLAAPLAKRIYTITPHSERALPADQLAGEIHRHSATPVFL